MTTSPNCPHELECSGCTLLHLNPEAQRERKKTLVAEKLGVPSSFIVFKSVNPSGFRTRTDLGFKRGTVGFYTKDREALFSLDQCPLFSQELQDLFLLVTEQMKTSLPVESGSLRLRTGPHGHRGLWLDISNLNALELLKNGSDFFANLSRQNLHIEIGQKGKVLKKAPAGPSKPLALADPEYLPWSETFVQGEPFLVFSSLLHFTQTGPQATQLMSEAIQGVLPQSPTRVFEFGCGIGTWTLPLARHARQLTAVDFSPSALQALRTTLAHYKVPNVELKKGDYRRAISEINDFETLFVNPARNGVGDLFVGLEKSAAKTIVYLSCFLDTLAQDIAPLNAKGYQISSVTVIDQFPHTDHMEILVQLQN